MTAPIADLSSIGTNLEELTKRIAALAAQAEADRDEESAVELYAVERQLRSASRRLVRFTSSGRRRR